MTWTWDETDITTDLARVRDAIGDTDSSAKLLSDERINALLALYPDWRVAAVHACDRLIAHFTRTPSSRSSLGHSTSRTLADHYRDLKAELAKQATGACTATLTGQSVSGKETLTSDSDAVQPWSARDQFDNND